MNKDKKSATANGVYNQLKEQILHLELTPGSIISEIETANRYEVSRTPVRDAFKALEREGLLEVRPHIGTFVSLIDLNAISDILYMRQVLEFAVLKDLSMIYNKSQEYRIRLALQNQKELIDSSLSKTELGRAFIRCDNDFHDTLFDIAGKKNVILYFRTINSQYERFRTLLNLGDKDNIIELYKEHESIFNAITNKDIDLLEKLVSHHIYNGFNSSAEVILKYSDFFKNDDIATR